MHPATRARKDAHNRLKEAVFQFGMACRMHERNKANQDFVDRQWGHVQQAIVTLVDKAHAEAIGE